MFLVTNLLAMAAFGAKRSGFGLRCSRLEGRCVNGRSFFHNSCELLLSFFTNNSRINLVQIWQRLQGKDTRSDVLILFWVYSHQELVYLLSLEDIGLFLLSTTLAFTRARFHDFGCDASVMIFSPNGDAERDAPANLSLAGDGFDTVIKAKEAVEAVCPGVVSCADVLALATRDVVVLTEGPSYTVELGRLDGLVSKASHVKGNLPGPDFSLKKLKAMFGKHNLNEVDLVALSGAHTIGVSHCNRFANRLYDFSPSNPVDPTLDPTYARQLIQACPQNVDPNIAVPMDPTSPRSFDNLYFQNLVQGKGMFTSDEVLFTDPKSRPIVKAFAGNVSEFSSAFVNAMKKLGRVGVKTGKRGEIRRDCTMFN